MRVLMLHDAPAPGTASTKGDLRADHLDTLAQAEAVSAALARRGHAVEPLAIGLDLEPLERRLRRGDIDVVFNGMETLGGHARLVAAAPCLVESLGVPMAGCCAEAIATTSNKPLAKRLMAAAGLPTPPWRTIDELMAGDGLTGPVIVKSACEHSSVGIDEASVLNLGGAQEPANQRRDLGEPLALCLARLQARLGGTGFAELFIDGRELVVGLLPSDDPSAPTALPPAEIHFHKWPPDQPRVVGFAAKWQEESRASRCTVPSFEFEAADEFLLHRVRQLALACWSLFRLGGHARVDFRVDDQGQPWILEVNANCCLTPGAGFARMLERAGIDYDEAMERLVLAALVRRTEGAMSRSARSASAASACGAARSNVFSQPAPSSSERPERAWRRALRPSDVAAVRDLATACGVFNEEEIRVAGELVEETLARGSTAGYDFLMADGDDGQLLGYACFGRIPLTQSSWDLYWIVVSPSHQGRGLGRRLMEAAIEEIAACGGTTVYAETSGRAQYAPTRAFYERCGWREVARMPDFYAPGDDKVVYGARCAGEEGAPAARAGGGARCAGGRAAAAPPRRAGREQDGVGR